MIWCVVNPAAEERHLYGGVALFLQNLLIFVR
jgi:hypothetical protein